MQSRHSKLYCLCSRDIQNFIVCVVATFKTLFVQSRHSKLYCLCSRDIQNFIVCAVETFKTFLFVQSRHSKLCLCSRAIRNFLVCVSLLGLRRNRTKLPQKFSEKFLVIESIPEAIYRLFFVVTNFSTQKIQENSRSAEKIIVFQEFSRALEENYKTSEIFKEFHEKCRNHVLTS